MLYLHVGIRVIGESTELHLECTFSNKSIMQCAAPTFWEIPLTDVWCQQVVGGVWRSV